jgi:cyanophycin synthetase
MEILNLRIMRGPNFWSASTHKLIVIRLVCTEADESLVDAVHKVFPGISLPDKKVSIPILTGYVAVFLQNEAGYDCSFVTTTSTADKETCNVAFEYEHESCGEHAAQLAVRYMNQVAQGIPPEVGAGIEELKLCKRRASRGPSTETIVQAAEDLGIPHRDVPDSSMVMFGYGTNQKRIVASLGDTTSYIGVNIAGNKHETKVLLQNSLIPVPNGVEISSPAELEEAVRQIGFPLVVKPLDGNHGRGITTNITDPGQLEAAFSLAKQVSDRVIVERFITGHDYRLLVIGYKLIAAALRTPPAITGDGQSTIGQLIDVLNSDPRRGRGHEKEMTLVEVDEITWKILREKGLDLNSVLPPGENLVLKDTANISSGGSAEDVTDIIHPDNIVLAERVAGVVGLDICGIDVMTPDISQPMNGVGAVIEVNAAPGLRMHVCPSAGHAREVGQAIMKQLYKDPEDARIPIVAITGTNGKTTTSRLIAHIAGACKKKVGFTTTEGIYIQGNQIMEGDCSGPKSTEIVLTDPTVDFAVLECARGGILRSGLGFDKCDIGVVTNVAEDHLGLKDINTIEDLARVKGVVPKSVRDEGYAVLNAEDDLVYKMAEGLSCEVALFGLDPENERLVSHRETGGLIATVENNRLVIRQDELIVDIMAVEDAPITFNGTAPFNIQNALAALLASYISGFETDDIREGLRTFVPSASLTPGRLNLFHMNGYDVLIDYAHNVHGLTALGQYISKLPHKPKIGIITGVGDRRDIDIIDFAALAASLFDEIIIRHDPDLRGRTKEQITALVVEGLNKHPDVPWKEISDEIDALQHACDNAPKGALVVLCVQEIEKVIDFIESMQQQEA